MNEIHELIQKLSTVDVSKTDLENGFAIKSKIAHFIAEWLEHAGLEAEIDEPEPGRSNVIGIARGSGGGRSLMLNTCFETIGVTVKEQSYKPFAIDNYLYRGSIDDIKGNLASVMLTIAAIKNWQLRGDVILTVVSNEDYDSIGTSSSIKNSHTDAAIVIEPTDLQICLAHKGLMRLEIETSGTAGQNTKPNPEMDAIVKMGRILVGIEELDRLLRSTTSHRLLGSGSIHASLIKGGQGLSSYPRFCVLNIERWLIPGETQEMIESEIDKVLSQAAVSDPDFRASVRTTLLREPFETSFDEYIVKVLSHHAAAILGHEPVLFGSSGWIGSTIFSSMDIPTVIFGSGEVGVHPTVEGVDLEQVELCIRILLATVKEFCA